MKRIVILLCLVLQGAWGAWAAFPAEKPITLQQAIQLALRQNPEILMAEGKLREAEGKQRQASAKLSPILALHGFADLGNTATMLDTTSSVEPMGWIMSSPGNGGNFGGVVSFSYPLFTAGYLGEMARSARFDFSSQREKLEMARLDVVAEATLAYDAVLEGRENLAAALADLNASREAERLAETYYKAGTVPYFYLLRSQARLSQSQESYLEAENALQIQSVQLSSVMGESSSEIFSPSGSLTSKFPPLREFDLVLETAYENRPDIKSAQDQMERYAADLKSVEGSFWPQVYFFSRYDSISGESPGAFNGYNVGIHASFPIFDGGERSGEMRETKGKMEEADAELVNLKLQAKNQVAETYFNFETALKELDAARAEVKSSEENLRVVMLRFQAGKGIQLEVLDAEKALTDARYREIKALFDANASYALLRRAEGTLSSPNP